MKKLEDMDLQDARDFATELFELNALTDALFKSISLSMQFNGLNLNEYHVALVLRKKEHQDVELTGGDVQYAVCGASSPMLHEEFAGLLTEAVQASAQAREEMKKVAH